MHICLYLVVKKGQNITIIMKKGEKILMSVGCFFRKINFLTGIILKFYQKSNSSLKNDFHYFQENISQKNLRIIIFKYNMF